MRRKSIARISGAGVFILSILAILAFCTRGLELITPRFVRADDIPYTDVQTVVVLSSGVVDDTTLDDAGAARLRTALAVAGAVHARRFVTSRIMTPTGQPTDSAQGRIVARAGLSVEWLILPGVVRNTRDEAIKFASLVPTTGRVAVVTSPLHTIRACAAFEAVGFSVTCVPATDPPRGILRRRWLALYGLLYERLAIQKYHYKGWMR